MIKPYVIGIVEDDDIYRFTIRKNIESLKFSKEIVSFSDGEEALNFMLNNISTKENLPDIILLDIFMPIMDGFEFMKEYVQIKDRLGKKIKVFMISSSINSEDVDRAKANNEISDYIVKPIGQTKLEQIMKDLQKKGLL